MMSDEEIEATAATKADAITLAAALHAILSETQEGETARIAIAALQGTQTGRDYMVANPLRF
jgi:hypothetical protein